MIQALRKQTEKKTNPKQNGLSEFDLELRNKGKAGKSNRRIKTLSLDSQDQRMGPRMEHAQSLSLLPGVRRAATVFKVKLSFSGGVCGNSPTASRQRGTKPKV